MLKTKKISQLAQKLFNLTMIEERLIARRNILEKKNLIENWMRENQKELKKE